MWNTEEFKLRLAEGTVFDHERIMLSSGDCSCFMPMVFMNEGGRVTAYYDCSGYTPLSKYRVESTDDALYILEKVAIILNNSVEYLITPSRITLAPQTVFFNESTGDIRIAYVPSANKKAGLKANIITLIGQLKVNIRDNRVYELDDLARAIYYSNYNLRDLINKIGLLRRH